MSSRLLPLAGMTMLFCFPLYGCSSKRFTDVTALAPSPDGAIAAASVVAAYGFGLYGGRGVTLSAKGGDPLSGSTVLAYGEDDHPPALRWSDANHLVIDLPCGWWTDLQNHWQLPETDRVIDISYLPAPTTCPPDHYARARRQVR